MDIMSAFRTSIEQIVNWSNNKLSSKVDKVDGKSLSTEDYTTEEKNKLSGIESGANKTTVDSSLSSTSTNPVQNKVINTKFTSVQSNIDSKVPNTRTVNGKALSTNITLSASDVGALPDTTVIPSIDGLATETYVDNKVAGLVDSAPATLDTLNELAAALGDDPNFATTVATQIGEKVDKVDGKGLSTNDLTATLKSNYDSAYIHSTSTHAPTDAEKNAIVGIQKNGTDLSVNSSTRKVNITVPTSASDVGAVPTSRTINGKALSEDITLSATDVDALPSSTAIITYDSLLPVESTTLIDADTLNGHGSDYFATDTDVSGLQSNISDLQTNISGLQSNIDGLQTNVNDLQTNVNGLQTNMNSLQTDVNDLQSSVSTIMSDKLSKSGGTMIGELVAQNNSNYTVAQVRNIFISTTEPSGGNNGDIWLQYSE